jgi:hypothetical protein
MLVTRENCLVEIVPFNKCFVTGGTWHWYIRGVLYTYKKEKVVGEEMRRIINLAKSTAQFDESFDESRASVLKLVFRMGTMKILRSWDETDVLYVGDVHSYNEYCFQPSPASDDIIAYVVVTPNRIIPVEIETLKERVW